MVSFAIRYIAMIILRFLCRKKYRLRVFQTESRDRRQTVFGDHVAIKEFPGEFHLETPGNNTDGATLVFYNAVPNVRSRHTEAS